MILSSNMFHREISLRNLSDGRVEILAEGPQDESNNLWGVERSKGRDFKQITYSIVLGLIGKQHFIYMRSVILFLFLFANNVYIYIFMCRYGHVSKFMTLLVKLLAFPVDLTESLIVETLEMQIEQWPKPWLFRVYKGLLATQLYGDYFIGQYKDPVINQPGWLVVHVNRVYEVDIDRHPLTPKLWWDDVMKGPPKYSV